jgi:hypothetical protein
VPACHGKLSGFEFTHPSKIVSDLRKGVAENWMDWRRRGCPNDVNPEEENYGYVVFKMNYPRTS